MTFGIFLERTNMDIAYYTCEIFYKNNKCIHEDFYPRLDTDKKEIEKLYNFEVVEYSYSFYRNEYNEKEIELEITLRQIV